MSAIPSVEPIVIYLHTCPFVAAEIDEHDRRILECRCFEGRRFLEMQDGWATRVDLERHSK